MTATHPIGVDVLYAMRVIATPCIPKDLRDTLARVRAEVSANVLRVTLYRLARERLLRRRAAQPNSPVSLTAAGLRITSLPRDVAVPPKAPDGLSYFVTYDVPEAQAPARNEFRARLKDVGWQRLHRSVWVSERDLRPEAMEAAARLGIESCVYLGTGALLKPLARTESAEFRAEIRRDLEAVPREVGTDLRGAFGRWVGTTERLRGGFGRVHVDDAMRAAWGAAEEALRRALGAGCAAR